MRTRVFMFPGQSSRYPEMIERLVREAPEEASTVLRVASAVLDRDLGAHYRAQNPLIFARNSDVQIGVFLANHIHLLALERAGVSASSSFGLSLGEYNHLVHIGALAFEDALRLVSARGAAYDAGPEGAMASVFPLPLELLREVVERARAAGPLDIANLNSPMQNVISGARAAIDAAAAILEEEHDCECRIIEPRTPMHSSVFRPVADVLRPALERAPWRTPRLPYLPNVLGRLVEEAEPRVFVDMLHRHVSSPVLFRDSVDGIAERHPDAMFIELGPRAVLYNLLSRKWRTNPRYKTDAPEGQPLDFDALAKEIAGAA